MMLCYEGLISVLLEIISNDFCAHALCVFEPFSLARMDLFTSSYLPHGVSLKVFRNMYKLRWRYHA